MSETILVGVDGTEASRAALRWSVRRAATIGAEVILTHVIDDAWTIPGTGMLDDLRGRARSLLEHEAELAHPLAPQVTVRTRLLCGTLMHELIGASQDADMVAVGTHKTGFINGKVFGSRSLRLAAAGRAPVAIIPQTSQRDGRGIVVGVDDSPAGRLAIRFAATEAERRGESLTLLRAFTTPDPLDGANAPHRELVRRIEERTSAILSEALALASKAAPGVETRTRSVRRPAAEALVSAAAAAALLVIGGSRQEETQQSMVGSVSHDVLINLTGPTVVVHMTDRR
jgi:nucleotide-binding universal stress UspA family protein